MFSIINNRKLSESEKCKIIREAVIENPEVLNQKDSVGSGLLHHAVRNKLTNVAKLLLELGYPIDQINSQGKTALHIAAEKGWNHLILLLIYHHCNFNLVDNDHQSALHKAIIHNHADSVRTLLLASKFQIDKTLRTLAGNTAEDLLLKITDIKLQEAFAEAFTIPPNLFGRSALHLAVINNSIDLVRLLLGLGAFINEKDNEGNTPLHLAAQCGHLQILLFLSHQNNIDMNAVDIEGNTALHKSIKEGMPNCVKILVSAKKNTNKKIKNDSGFTAADLIENWRIENPVLAFALQKALSKTQLSNGTSEQHENEVFNSPKTESDNYLDYLRKYFKKLVLSLEESGDKLEPPLTSKLIRRESLTSRRGSALDQPPLLNIPRPLPVINKKIRGEAGENNLFKLPRSISSSKKRNGLYPGRSLGESVPLTVLPADEKRMTEPSEGTLVKLPQPTSHGLIGQGTHRIRSKRNLRRNSLTDRVFIPMLRLWRERNRKKERNSCS